MNIPEPKPHVYLRSELRSLMGAIALAAQAGNNSDEYMAGFSAALLSMAVGLGLEEMPAPAPRRQKVTIEEPHWVRLTGGR